MGKVRVDELARVRLCGFVLAFDRLAKASAFVFNANASVFVSEVSCSLSSCPNFWDHPSAHICDHPSARPAPNFRSKVFYLFFALHVATSRQLVLVPSCPFLMCVSLSPHTN